jgi:hypothetical protein
MEWMDEWNGWTNGMDGWMEWMDSSMVTVLIGTVGILIVMGM